MAMTQITIALEAKRATASTLEGSPVCVSEVFDEPGVWELEYVPLEVRPEDPSAAPPAPRSPVYKVPSKQGRQCTKPDRAEKPSVQSPVQTGAAVYKVGLCALEGSFRRDFVHSRPRPVYKPPSKQGSQCTKSTAHTSAAKKYPSPTCESVRNGEKPAKNR